MATSLRYAQKYADEANAKQPRITVEVPKPAPANKGNIAANISALSACDTAEEQKQMLQAMLGDLSGLRPLGSRVLVATYVNADKSPGGIIYTDKKKENARYEGKVGLVLAVGPTAFKYDGSFEWEGPMPKVGDWIWYRASDAPERFIKNVSCRTISDDLIEGITDDPVAVY